MEGMFAGQTDPVPFITAAYVFGLAFIVGTPVLLHLQFAKLSKLLTAMAQPRKD